MSLILSRSFVSSDSPVHQFDTSSIIQEIEHFSTLFDAWCETQMKEHINCKQNYITAEQKNRTTVQQLLSMKSSFETQARQLDLEIQRQDNLLRELKKTLDQIKLDESVLLPQISTIAVEKEQKQKQLAEEKEIFNQRMVQHKLRQAELSKGVSLYQQRLGLEFRRNNSSIQVIFTKIDPKHVDLPFSFTFRINAEEEYELLACEPRLHGLRPVVEELNKTQNVQQFVITMRGKFKELVGH